MSRKELQTLMRYCKYMHILLCCVSKCNECGPTLAICSIMFTVAVNIVSGKKNIKSPYGKTI